MRSSIVPPTQDSDYWSSSTLVKQYIQEYGQKWFTKKIIAIYPTREEALKHEIYLHTYFDVAHHPAFMNKANQTSTKFTYTHTKPFSQDHLQWYFDACAQNPNRMIRPIPKQLIERHKTIQSIASRACICPYCNKKGTWPNMQSTHFEFCPKNPNRKYWKLSILECPYCGKTGRGNAMYQWYFEKCRHKPSDDKCDPTHIE